MRTSKYLGLKSGLWTCTHVGVASVQPAFKKYERDALGRRVRSKSPGSKQYYYIFERLTSDNKAMKMIRLNAQQAMYVLRGIKTVEDYAEKKQSVRSQVFKDKVSYSFCD